MNTAQPERTAQTRDNLCQAFWELHRDQQLSRISVGAICRKAGYHRSTFYKYFRDPAHLRGQTEREIIDYCRQALPQQAEEGMQDVWLSHFLSELYRRYGSNIAILTGPTGDPSFKYQLKDALVPSFCYLMGLNVERAEQRMRCQLVISGLFDLVSDWYRLHEQLSQAQVTSFASSLMQAVATLPPEQEQREVEAADHIAAADAADATDAADAALSHHNRFVRKAEQFVREHYAEPLTLADAAAQVGLNPAYLSALFKKTANCGFREYLNRVRIAAAREKLLHTEEAIVDIASNCGFNDQSYFTKVFKTATGLTPREYRELGPSSTQTK